METLIDKNISKEGEYGSYTLLAAGATWNDSTSYSRREKDKKQYYGNGFKNFTTVQPIR